MVNQSNRDQGFSIASPHTVLEAGGESIEILLDAVARSIEEMTRGQVLQVVSSAECARISLVEWCRQMKHELLDMLLDGEEGQFWIRKGGLP